MSIGRLSLGTAQLGMPYGVANRQGLPSEDEIDAILTLALDAGISRLDTAPAYGTAEQRIGSFVRRNSAGRTFRVCTKLERVDGGLRPGALAATVVRSIGGSLERLAMDELDGLLVHDPATLDLYGNALIDVLLGERERGRVRRIGISVYSPAEAALANEYPELEIVQHPLSILDQRLLESGALTAARSRGIEVQARSIFLQGLIVLDPDMLPAHLAHASATLVEMNSVLADNGWSAREAALAFVLATDVDRVIIGLESQAQLEANLASLSRPMPCSLFDALESAFRSLPRQLVDPRRWATA